MEHLSLEIFDLEGTGSMYAYLPEDASITITDTSEVFASGDVWSHSFRLNVRANAHIFGTSGDMHGSRLHEQVGRRRARLWVEGIALYYGYMRLDDEAEVDDEGNVDVSFESGHKTFDEMIEGAKANQVPMMGDVQIGMALWRKRWTRYRVRLTASVDGWEETDEDRLRKLTFSGTVTHDGSEWLQFGYDGESEGNSSQQYPRMVFPNGSFADYGGDGPDEDADHVNTDSPYDDSHPYCNVALCYQRTGYQKKNPDGSVYDDYSSEPEAQRGYEVMPANRVNSAPNFFVIYWIRALMKHLGIHIDENQMMDVEDLRRLFFVNTRCAYEEPESLSGTDRTRYGRYVQEDQQGRLVPEYIDSRRNVRAEESGFTGENVRITWGAGVVLSGKASVAVSDIEGWSDQDKSDYVSHNSFFHRAYATSDCFPDADVSEVIKAIETGFGVRFLFSDSYQRVRIVLLRNVFRGGDVQEIACEVLTQGKKENCIRGFRMTYGDSEDTAFYYKGFADKLPHKKKLWADSSDRHDYSHWDLDADYAKLIHKISAFDKTCYVTGNTGNAFGIKVDKDAKRYDELHPSLFEYAGFMDAEDGDCTGEEGTIETVQVGFAPAVMNDVNFEQERSNGDTTQRFALFVDESMRPRRPDLKDGKDYDDPRTVYDIDKLFGDDSPASGMKSDDGIVKPGEFAITSDMYASRSGVEAEVRCTPWGLLPISCRIAFDIDGHINEGYRLYLQDNFEPNDSGVSPVETKDWGLTLGIMRGSGSDAYVGYTADPDDGEGNDTWEVVAGSNATVHPDTCDSYGNEWDYNGTIHAGSAAEAEAAIRSRYPDTAGTILDPRWPVTAQELADAGWEVGGDLTRRANYYYYRLTLSDPAEGYVNVYATPIASSSSRSYTGPSVYTREELKEYILNLWNQYQFDLVNHDNLRLIYAVDPADWSTLAYLRAVYHGYATESDLDNGLGVTDGRFSLKLRAEKLNPYFDPSQEESAANRRYLEISNPNLRGRGLMDKFYKEYSYWVRNARIARFTVRMELAQLLAIDKTKRVAVGDVTGFIRKMQYSVSNRTGLGIVTMEIMYI